MRCSRTILSRPKAGSGLTIRQSSGLSGHVLADMPRTRTGGVFSERANGLRRTEYGAHP